jgi:hypothetical protein
MHFQTDRLQKEGNGRVIKGSCRNEWKFEGPGIIGWVEKEGLDFMGNRLYTVYFEKR